MILAASTPLPKIWPLLRPALVETAQMVLATAAIEILIGIPLGVFLYNVSAHGLFPNRSIAATLNWIVNIMRSLPFLIIMAISLPLTKMLVGTSIGVRAAIIPMCLVSIPYFARLAESAFRELPSESMDVGKASAASNLQIIWKVQIAEAAPALASAATVAVIGVIGLSAIAGTMGAGGIGYLAIAYGYERFDYSMLAACAVVLVAVVQVLQIAGNLLHRFLHKS